MIIDLTNVKDEEEIALHYEIEPSAYDLEFDDFHYTKKIVLEGMAKRLQDSLMVDGRLKSACEIYCSRCLKPLAKDIDEPLNVFIDIKGKQSVDLTDNVRENLVFLHDYQYLCCDACKGLCPQCGINLNDEQCTCSKKKKEPEPHSSFAQLKTLMQAKKKKKES
jgi:uncharacterized protein